MKATRNQVPASMKHLVEATHQSGQGAAEREQERTARKLKKLMRRVQGLNEIAQAS